MAMLLTCNCATLHEHAKAQSLPSTASVAALLVRNDYDAHVAMASTPKVMDAWEAIEATDGLQGDIVEVGVYKGGTSMVMAYSLFHMARKRTVVYMYRVDFTSIIMALM